VLDPALALAIEPVWPYRRRKLRVAWPAIVWATVALWLLGSRWGQAPPWPLLMGLLVAAPVVIALPIPAALRNLREIRAARRVRARNLAGMKRLLEGDAVSAEVLFRECLAEPNLNPPSLAALVHNLGMSALAQGDEPRGGALLRHAESGGWTRTWAWQRALRAGDVAGGR
jgi:hypothetical protein